MALCISCAEREGDPHKGGLCSVCAPFGKVGRRTHSIVITVWQLLTK